MNAKKKFIQLESLERTPNVQILSVIKYPVQPYREFMYFCSEKFYDSMENKTGLSLKDLYDQVNANSSTEDKKTAVAKIADMIVERCPGLSWDYSTEYQNSRIFIDVDLNYNGSKICNLKFYTHMSFISPEKMGDRVWAACQFDFTPFDGFDFLELDRDNNIFDFCKDDECKETFDMVIACVQGLINFTDFIKEYKVKKITANNIQQFIQKIIVKQVDDVQVLFGIHEFVISAVCGEDIVKNKYDYDNYLASVRDFSDYIKNTYGDKFAHKEEQTDSSTEAQS